MAADCYVIDRASFLIQAILPMISGSVNKTHPTLDALFQGFAYIEFAEKESVDASMALEGSMFKGRQIKGKISYQLYQTLFISAIV